MKSQLILHNNHTKHRHWVFYLLLLTTSIGVAHAADIVTHQLFVQITPEESELFIEDSVVLPKKVIENDYVNFVLNSKFKLMSAGKAYEQLDELTEEFSHHETSRDLTLTQYRAYLEKGQSVLNIRYAGKIKQKLLPADQEYARSYAETTGTVQEQGVYLSNSTFWYPQFGLQLMKFSLKTDVPEPWVTISQGERVEISHQDGRVTSTWKMDHPQTEIYLIANKFIQYQQSAGASEAQVYLMQKDDALAQKYMDVTTQYLSMYSRLLGPYPYNKFALVENFWDSGYGMPSFTLLGPKIIRFPFILHSSYPHEILHNWWGNGVYVDYEKGNWAEGLTAYMADHLVAEQRGKGAQYRRDVLQKYTDFVTEERDFPLSEFRSRHSSVSEAVGYGKTLMLFHMLRMQYGDAEFIRALSNFYRKFRFKLATFSDLQDEFSAATGHDQQAFFQQWVQQTGAPQLELKEVNVQARTLLDPSSELTEPMPDHASAQSSQDREGLMETSVPDSTLGNAKPDITQSRSYRLKGVVEQLQTGNPFQVHLPVSVELLGEQNVFQTRVELTEKHQEFVIDLPAKPIKISLDPEFDTFRRLHQEEVPAALSQAFGAENVLVLLPTDVSEEKRYTYQQMAQSWKVSQPGLWEIMDDTDISQLPKNKSIWLLGWSNKHLPLISPELPHHHATIDDRGLTLNRRIYTEGQHSVVTAAKHPQNNAQTIVWLAASNSKAIQGLTRKLPHYRKYSYLAFKGEEPENVSKGQWTVKQSPMTKILSTSGNEKGVIARLAPRSALAQLPPLFSEQRLKQDVQYLSSEVLQGRVVNSTQVIKAAEYIATQFRDAGLLPFSRLENYSEIGSQSEVQIQDYFQSWRETIDPSDPLSSASFTNVIGFLPGKNPQLKYESVVVSAHYDHIGLKNELAIDNQDELGTKPENAADDSASGIAVMLEFARGIAKKWKPERSILFIAFSGSELGLIGSKHFINHPITGLIPRRLMSAVNMDSVGYLDGQELKVLGTQSASEWAHIFRGVGFVTGLKVSSVATEIGISDQVSFLDVGVPAVQFITNAKHEMNKGSDELTNSINNIDYAGLVKVSTILSETIDYLSNRIEPMTLSDQLKAKAIKNVGLVDGHQNNPSHSVNDLLSKVQVNIGTIPDFSYQGKGVKVTGTTPGSPAEQAGIQGGDVLLSLNGNALADLKGYSNELKSLKAGQKVTLKIERKGTQLDIQLQVLPQ